MGGVASLMPPIAPPETVFDYQQNQSEHTTVSILSL
jgi:hypothetical protein